MWTLRRASIHLKNQGLSSVASRICSGKSEVARCYLDNCITEHIGTEEPPFEGLVSSARSYSTFSSFSKSCNDLLRSFSSHNGVKSSEEEEDKLEDGFSELETPNDAVKVTTTSVDENDGELLSESEDDGDADDTQNELESLGTEADKKEKKSLNTKRIPSMAKALLDNNILSVSKVLNTWVEEGNEVTQAEIAGTISFLRKRKFYLKALQVLKWLESTKHIEPKETNYASRVDMIAKVHSLSKAEEYLQKIPKSLQGEIVYSNLLVNYVAKSNKKKSEELFNKMKKLGFSLSCYTCNLMLILYKKTDKKKISDILLLMEKENLKPNAFTYQTLIDTKGLVHDISGMEQVVETMKAEGVKSNTQIQIILARHYVNSGLKDKAEAILKELEGDNIKENRWLCRYALPIYAKMGKEKEVERIWDVCKSNPMYDEAISAIEAWGLLKRIEKAEDAFSKYVPKKSSGKQFTALLKVYIENKMLSKGKELVKQMAEIGCRIGPQTWDSLVKLYIGAGELEKADSILEKATQQNNMRGLYVSYLTILDSYAKRGDIHNAEKIFLKIKQVGYTVGHGQYQTLLKAYLNAKVPPYGFSDRLKADGLFPNNIMLSQLARTNYFVKSPVLVD